ncbi:PQQ-binding-like beta-propeller repeat protein [Salinicola aestuarinus]|uniref:outer membrane protein assembly factor BamB family protein n=1 Tax=Salinicola aestuarinus TaxID=1949082 RepID=UPI000DA11E09|nr:PQQ-binding-like beta-propeller repeat protein [Salinicola aestuarinus]
MPFASSSHRHPLYSRLGGLVVLSLMTLEPAGAEGARCRLDAERSADIDTLAEPRRERITELRTPEEVRTPPTVFAGDLLVGNQEGGALKRLDPASGETRWRLDAPNWIHSDIAWERGIGVVGYGNRFSPPGARANVTGDLLGSGKSGLLAVDLETGKPVWHYRGTGESMLTPVLHAGEVFAAGGDRALHVLSLEDGRQTGLIKLGAYVGLSSPTLDDEGRLFIGGAAPYRLFCVDPMTRSVVWMAEFGEVVAGLDSVPPAIEGDLVLTTAVVTASRPRRFSHRLFAVDAQSGERRWSADLGENRSRDASVLGTPTVAEGCVVVVGATGDTLHAFDLRSGETRWQLGCGPILGAPVIEGDSVYVTLVAGELLGADLATGEAHFRASLGEAPRASAGPVRLGGHLIVPADNGQLYLVPLPS